MTSDPTCRWGFVVKMAGKTLLSGGQVKFLCLTKGVRGVYMGKLGKTVPFARQNVKSFSSVRALDMHLTTLTATAYIDAAVLLLAFVSKRGHLMK